MNNNEQQRLMSGIQPTGHVHIGNLEGAIRNWVELQHEYRSFFSIVDYHAVTVQYDPAELAGRVVELARWLLAAGIDPEKATLFIQSDVPRHTELCWLLNTVTPMGELGRMTQFKDKSQSNANNINVGLFDYPVLQAGDILIYMAGVVPVGEDQVQHLELSRDIARAWNRRYATDEFRLPEPKPVLTTARRIVGLDGAAKMSKSKDNTIGLGDDAETVWNKLRPAKTDERRQRLSDPGVPEDCPMFALHEIYTDDEKRGELDHACRNAEIGCFDCKKVLAANLSARLAPIQERYGELSAASGRVEEILAAGGERARTAAEASMAKIRNAMGLDGWRR